MRFRLSDELIKKMDEVAPFLCHLPEGVKIREDAPDEIKLKYQEVLIQHEKEKREALPDIEDFII